MIEFACEDIWSWTFFGNFLITVSILVLVISLFIFSISSWFSLGRLYLRIFSFPLGCPIYWCIVACNSRMILCIYVASIVTSFSFLILLIWAFSLFSWWFWLKGFSTLFIFLEDELLVSLIFAIVCLYFCSDIYDFFPSTNFGFCLSLFLELL